MSRSALWRQEGNVRERQRRTDELFQQACEEGRTRSKSTLAYWPPDNDTFHMNPLLLQNTMSSSYFQKCCTNLHDWTSIIDEIYYEVKHLQVFQIGKQPSTAFCLLVRLLCYRMTSHELEQTIKHVDSPYIRAIGFLYIRFGGCPPEQVWDWIEPYIHDDDVEFTTEVAGKQQQHGENTITIGEYVRNLFQLRDYYGATPLPRYPLHIERDLQVKLLAADKIAARAKQHYKDQQKMQYFQTIGSTIQALYGDAENPVTWYKAIIDRIITRSDDGKHNLKYPKFVVTFPEYGNTETVTLGEIDMLGNGSDEYKNDCQYRGGERSNNGRDHVRSRGRDYDEHDERKTSTGGHENLGYNNRHIQHENNMNYHSRNRQQHHRGGVGVGGGSSNDHQNHDLFEEVRRAERDKVASSDKGNWAPRRPPSTKHSLAMQGTHTIRDEITTNRVDKHQQTSHSVNHGGSSTAKQHLNPAEGSTAALPLPRKRTAEEIAAIEGKKRKLLSKYG